MYLKALQSLKTWKLFCYWKLIHVQSTWKILNITSEFPLVTKWVNNLWIKRYCRLHNEKSLPRKNEILCKNNSRHIFHLEMGKRWKMINKFKPANHLRDSSLHTKTYTKAASNLKHLFSPFLGLETEFVGYHIFFLAFLLMQNGNPFTSCFHSHSSTRCGRWKRKLTADQILKPFDLSRFQKYWTCFEMNLTRCGNFFKVQCSWIQIYGFKFCTK